jgi:hypothetical protein
VADAIFDTISRGRAGTTGRITSAIATHTLDAIAGQTLTVVLANSGFSELRHAGVVQAIFHGGGSTAGVVKVIADFKACIGGCVTQ